MCEICEYLHELPWRFLRWMLHVLRRDEWHWHWQKAATSYNQENDITIRATYYIFCCRNRNWDSRDLMQFLFFSFFFCFCFVLFFFFNHPISSSICKLPIHSEIYYCAFKNTSKVSIIIIIIKKDREN